MPNVLDATEKHLSIPRRSKIVNEEMNRTVYPRKHVDHGADCHEQIIKSSDR